MAFIQDNVISLLEDCISAYKFVFKVVPVQYLLCGHNTRSSLHLQIMRPSSSERSNDRH